ncbi:MAG: DNA starvation/stationary phase protection protein Dps [Fischerella sp.]|jgi:starvation-inducible DNA-binding protein|uniref:DNA starvation/stationary phase protection protein Dps n=1 Tax=Fischerella sp. TaxID=1191 RepID=UPI0017936AA2|nr:DNA starvation/stationary phase protection protein Dps [Fischerella sp.]NWF58259.1 DNA starvation/stationary phase protection protein Dps [Fischerella sp.]
MNGSSEPRGIRSDAIGIILPLELRSQIIDILNQTLATTVDLKTQIKQAYWNVEAQNSHDIHELFDEIATELDLYIDLLAQRVTNLGGLAMGTARNAAGQSILPEYPLNIIERKDHIASVAERLAIYGNLLWENIDRTAVLGDADTAYLYAEISMVVDKRLWFLDTHLVNSVMNVNHQLAEYN